MGIWKVRTRLFVGTALTVGCFGPALAQTTPGDRSGTPAAAGTGQSAATPTSAPARAGVVTQDGEGGSGDIVVTARRVEERLQDVPISITVLNQQQISSRNIINAGDIATYTPSLTTNPNFGTEFTTFAIRGFVQDPSTAPSVGVYFADVVAPRGPTQGTQAGDGAGPGNLFDLQNIQVLKGPQGTLFGRNTTGGAVLFVPQKPTAQFGGYVEGSYGNYDMRRFQGALNVPLSDIARLRLAGDYLQRDGYLKNTSDLSARRFNDIDYYSLRGSLVVDLTPDLENYTVVSYTHSNTNGTTKKLVACDPTSALGNLLFCPALTRLKAANAGFYGVQAALANPRSRLDTWQVINTTTWRASDTLTFKNIASYGQLSAFQRSPLFGVEIQFGIPALGIPLQRFEFSVINPTPNYRNVFQSTFTEEFQAQGSAFDGRLTYQGGVYFERSLPLGRVGTRGATFPAVRGPRQFQLHRRARHRVQRGLGLQGADLGRRLEPDARAHLVPQRRHLQPGDLQPDRPAEVYRRHPLYVGPRVQHEPARVLPVLDDAAVHAGADRDVHRQFRHPVRRQQLLRDHRPEVGQADLSGRSRLQADRQPAALREIYARLPCGRPLHQLAGGAARVRPGEGRRV